MNVDAATGSFVALLAIIALNRLAIPAAGRRLGRWLHWPIQAINAAGAVLLVGWGMPGLGDGLRIVDWFVAGVLLLHVLENHARWMRRRSRAEGDPNGPAATGG